MFFRAEENLCYKGALIILRVLNKNVKETLAPERQEIPSPLIPLVKCLNYFVVLIWSLDVPWRFHSWKTTVKVGWLGPSNKWVTCREYWKGVDSLSIIPAIEKVVKTMTISATPQKTLSLWSIVSSTLGNIFPVICTL